MPVDINDILHVLAHELRTPVGIAHGYVRLLLEDRLPLEADRRRALEQMQKALGRLGELSNETTALAAWYDEGSDGDERADARSIAERLAAVTYDSPIAVDVADVGDSLVLRTPNPDALTSAFVNVIRATARELRGLPCSVFARTAGRSFEVLIGPPDQALALAAGPTAPGAGPIPLERGGLGLALVHAAIVLDAHGAERWTMNNSRQTAAIRLPLEERPLP